jgi:lysophospholipase L1-like esterase
VAAELPSTERVTRWARAARRLALVLLLLAILGEIAARIWDGTRGGTGSLYDYVVPAGSRFKMRSGSSILVPERYGDIRYRINRAGYRDDEPRPGRRRIVVLGDSVSFGLGVQQEEIWPSLLEQRLQRERLQPRAVENLAIWAYNTANEADALREDGLALKPEVVILQFYMNDFSIAPPPKPGAPPPPSLGQRLTALKNRLLFSSALYRRLYQAGTGLSFALFHDLRRRHFPESLNDAEPRGESALLRATPDDADLAAFGEIRAIRDLARGHRGYGGQGARLLVVLSPDEVQLFTGRYDVINERMHAFCAREGIDLLDPLPVYRASPDRLDLFYDGVHYSPRGHALLTRLVFAELARRGLLRGKA